MPVRTRRLMQGPEAENAILVQCPPRLALPGFSRRSARSADKKNGPANRPVRCCSTLRSAEALLEVADLALGAVTLPAVLLLQLARQVFAVAFGDIEHIVGEIAPPRLRLALDLGPLAGNDVLVHMRHLVDGGKVTALAVDPGPSCGPPHVGTVKVSLAGLHLDDCGFSGTFSGDRWRRCHRPRPRPARRPSARPCQHRQRCCRRKACPRKTARRK